MPNSTNTVLNPQLKELIAEAQDLVQRYQEHMQDDNLMQALSAATRSISLLQKITKELVDEYQ